MENIDYTTYPLGYIGVRIDDHRDTEPDLYIDELFEQYLSLNTLLKLRELRMAVFEYAFNQFSPFLGVEGFIKYNLDNAKLTTLQRRFLYDTLKFIKSGKRDIDISSWQYMLKNSEELDIKSVGKDAMMKPTTPDTSIGDWVKHDGGFQDMLWTLKIIFGSVNNNRINMPFL